MRAIKNFFKTPFVSAMLGGILVAAVGLVALDAGWIEAGESDAPAQQTMPAIAETRPATGGSGQGMTIGEIYDRHAKGVAFIEATKKSQESFSPFGAPQQGQGIATGSGFVVSKDGKILTNHHVVEGASEIEVKLGDSDSSYSAKLIGDDPSTDLALIQIENPEGELHALELGDSSNVRVGDPVVAIGNPFGLDRTVTSGIVSALQRQIQAPNGVAIANVIQTDAPINPGNSGGPLLNAQGEVIGINSQIHTGGYGQGNIGIGFAVPINTAKNVIEQIEKTGTVKHAFIGIVGNNISEQAAKALNLGIKSGVAVAEVAEGSPADKAGLKAGNTTVIVEGEEIVLGGDIITELNGEKVDSMEDVINAVSTAKVGDEIELTVSRDGEERQVKLTLAARPDDR